MGKERLKSTVAGVLAGINMMIPTGGLATSKEVTSEDIKPTTSISDVLIGENKNGELEKLEEMEVNQRFSQFLAGEGEYSDEKLELKLFRFYKSEPDLGYLKTIKNGFFSFQSVLLFHKKINGGEILALGLKNKQRKRIVTGVYWPISDILKLGYGVGIGLTNQDLQWGKSTVYTDVSKIDPVLDEKIGSVLNVTMDYSSNDINKQFPNEEYRRLYNSFFSKKGDINKSFLTGIWRPNEKDTTNLDKTLFQKIKNKGSVLEIENYSDFLNLANRSEDLPFMTFFSHQ